MGCSAVGSQSKINDTMLLVMTRPCGAVTGDWVVTICFPCDVLINTATYTEVLLQSASWVFADQGTWAQGGNCCIPHGTFVACFKTAIPF